MEEYLAAVKALAPAPPDFERVTIPGFQNDGVSISTGTVEDSCAARRRNATLGVLPSFPLDEDLIHTVQGLVQDYPPIAETFRNQRLGFEEFVRRYWAETAGSGVWLPDYRVYLVVSTVVFFPSGDLAAPMVSFLRGRIFDETWRQRDGYALDWDGEVITFPRIFDVPIDWGVDGAFLGAEDPRVVIEDGVPGAEPAIVFNMVSAQQGRRTMWTHRPFSNLTAPFTIHGQELQHDEKDWAPFFHADGAPHRRPGNHLHFVSSLQPLRILRCQLLHGYCDWVYNQQGLSGQLVQPSSHQSAQATIRGGTNFVPVHQSDPDMRLWAGFTSTHLDGACGSSTDRPELVILANSGPDFHVIYASEAMDFGNAVLDPTARETPCGEEQSLVANGIVRWDQDRRDLMQLSLSVGARSTRVVSLRGISQLVWSLPYLGEWRRETSPKEEPWGLRWSVAGAEVVQCSVMAAVNASVDVPVSG